MLVLVFLLFVCTQGQDICSNSVAIAQQQTGRPKLSNPEKVLYVNILPGYDNDMYQGYLKLVETLKTYSSFYGASTAEFYSLTPAARALDLSTLEKYTQIWVADLAPTDDNSVTQMASYRAIAQWYIKKGYPHIICDGRWISELWSPNAYRPSQKLVENYFANLAVRGGGLVLATDHAEAFTRGINEINKLIGINVFNGFFYSPPYLLEVDNQAPLMNYPNDPTHHNAGGKYYIYDDSSTAFTPYNIQPNGQILYPIGWHGAKGETNPGLSTTIRGTHGFLIDITSPACAARIVGTTKVNFKAVIVKGGTGNIAWQWVNSAGTVLSTDQAFVWTAPTGHHLIKVTATDSQKLVAEATVSFRVVYDSTQDNGGLGPNGDGSCYIFLREGKEVTEVFPVARVATPVAYYNLKNGEASIADGIQAKSPKSANFFLYTDGKSLAFEAVMSNVALTSALNVVLTGRGTGPNTTLALRDDTLDTITWSATTSSGSAVFRWKDTTKGFVIDGLPRLSGPQNNWCFDVTIKASENLDYFSEYSHILPGRGAVPNPSAVDGSFYYIQSIPSFSYCKTTCYSPPTVTLTALQGVFGPISVDWAANTGGLAYNDKAPTTWLLKPAAQNITGIAVHFVGPYGIASSDLLKVFPGDDTVTTAPIVSISAGGTVAPASVKIDKTTGVVRWTPTNDRSVARGWTIWYSVIPTVTSIFPINGPVQSHSWVTISGANFIDTGKNVIRFGNIEIKGADIKFDSPNAIRVNVPPVLSTMTVPVSVSNDGVFFQNLTQKYTYFTGTCKDVTACNDCFNLQGCGWCTDLTTAGASFCYAINGTTGVTCPQDDNHNSDNDCSDAPDFKVTVMEGESVYIRVLKPELKNKVTQIKITGSYKGTIANVTAGIAKVDDKGRILFTSYLYLNQKINQDTFTYELSGPNGYKESGVVTVDVTPLSREYLDQLHALEIADECKDGTHNCQQLCLDGTPIPGYICGCKPGYTLVKNRFCDDIDECTKPNHGCLYGCTNLPGTYSCDCKPGYAKNTAGICTLLPCPLSPWVEDPNDDDDSTVTLDQNLPAFVKAVVTMQQSYNTSQIPGWDCPLCLSSSTSSRTINHTAWNGSPQCAADRAALVDVQTCSYPCLGESVFDPLEAVSFVMKELTEAEWLEKALGQILGNTGLFFERPVTTDGTDPYSLPYFYVVVSNCDATKLQQTAAGLSAVISDILPQFTSKDKVRVEIVDSAEKYCAIKVTFDPIVVSLEDCANALYQQQTPQPVDV